MKKFLVIFSVLIVAIPTLVLAMGESPKRSAPSPTQFAIDLYGKLKTENGNVFFSPVSISAALAMAGEGARGQTADEMQAVIQYPADPVARRSFYSSLIRGLNASTPKVQLIMANALWAQKGYRFLPGYLAVVKRDYLGQAAELDFERAAEKSRKTINQWVAGKTGQKIKDLFAPGSLTDATRLVLTNAIYFKAAWADPFHKNRTSLQEFRVSTGHSVKAPLMKNTDGRFGYAETDDLQILEMPYKGNRLSMIVLLPKGDDLSALENKLSADQLDEWIGQIHHRRVDIFIPKFTFSQRYPLAKTLEEMGMPTAFSDQADFSGMDGTHNLAIQTVIHQAFVDVNEQGTEAAAATGVAIGVTSFMPQPVPTFRADHPFLFLIRDKQTGSILFLGRLSNPVK